MLQNRDFGPVLGILGLKMPFFRAVFGDFEAGAKRRPLARVGGLRGEWGAPRDRANVAKTHMVMFPAGLAGAPLYPGPLPCGTRGPRVFFRRGGEAGGCGFPRLGFPPGAPLSEAPPFRVRIIGRGENPSPFGRLRSLTGGNRTAAIFVYGAAALPPSPRLRRTQSGPPA